MSKIVTISGLLLIFVLIATTSFVPQGYITMSYDEKEVLGEGEHLFSTHPFEYKKIYAINGNATEDVIVFAKDGIGIILKMNLSWRLNTSDSAKMRYIYVNFEGDGSANPIQQNIRDIFGKSDFDLFKSTFESLRGENNRNMIVTTVIYKVKSEFVYWNSAEDIMKAENYTTVEQYAVEHANKMLSDDFGIEVTSVSLKTEYPQYKEAIKKKQQMEEVAREEIKKLAETLAENIRREAIKEILDRIPEDQRCLEYIRLAKDGFVSRIQSDYNQYCANSAIVAISR